MFARILAVLRKEFIHIRRDPRTLGIALLMPVFQLVIFGYAVTNDVEHLPLAVFDQDQSASSHALIGAYRSSTYFTIAYNAQSYAELTYLMDSGRARVALAVPPDYENHLLRGEPAQVSLIIDGSDPTIANTALAAGAGIGQAHGAALAVTRLPLLAAAGQQAVDVRTRVWYNPDMISANYMVPALIGLILQVLTALLTAVSVVREREQGTLEGLIVTPIRPLELILGKVFPYVILAFADTIEILLVGHFWFHVPINGSVVLLLALSALFLLTSLGIGLLISSVSRTQQEAMMMAFFTILPSVFLSGFMFPIVAMPPVLQAATRLVPLTYFLVIDRGIVLKGNSMDILLPQVVALGVFGVAMLGLAAARFKKRLE